MGFKNLLLGLGTVSFFIFFILTLLVSQSLWQQFDIDSMVGLQNMIPKSWDPFLSLFSYLGNAEVTIGLAFALSASAFLKKELGAAVGWLGIIPATAVEVLGKLFVYHPPPSAEFLRTIKTIDIPSVYVQTDFSYPSGHVTRTTFLLMVALIIIWRSKKTDRFKNITTLGLLIFIILMIISRVSLGEHWLSDVLGGIILGASAAFFSAFLILRKRHSQT
jgi:undecaprenyl-diphosphatase